MSVNTFKDDKKYNLNFVWNPLCEFQNALVFIANKDQYIQIFKEQGEELATLKYIEEMEKKLSPFLRRELIFFFGHPINQSNIGSRLVIDKAISNQSPLSVIEGLNAIEQMNEITIVSQMVKYATQAYFNNYLSQYDWEDVKHDPATMLKLLERSDFPQNEITGRLQECLRYPVEIKQRFCMLMRRFYENVYLSFEEHIRLFSKSGFDKYYSLYKKDPKSFVNYYFKIEEDDLEPIVNIHISVFDQMCSVHYSYKFKDKSHSWIFLGIHIDRFLGTKPRREQVDLFLKLLSDKKRVKIIEMLADSPTYTQELSAKLELTPAAISYHMAFLFNLDLVAIHKRQNRRYYTLDKERMKNYFSLTQDLLLK